MNKKEIIEKTEKFLNLKYTEKNFFEKLLKKIKEDKNIKNVFSIEEIISLEKERIKNGELDLTLIKNHLLVNPNKEIRKIIVSIDSVNVLFARVKAFLDTEIFKDIDLKKIIHSLAQRNKNGAKIEYGYFIKNISKPIEKFEINEKIKKEYFSLEKELKDNPDKEYILF
jgi:hypothetical protein